MTEQQLRDEAKNYVNNHVQNPEFFDFLPDVSPKKLNEYCERVYFDAAKKHQTPSPTGDRDCEELKEALRELVEQYEFLAEEKFREMGTTIEDEMSELPTLAKAKQLLNKHP